jgi:hypothetical protein
VSSPFDPCRDETAERALNRVRGCFAEPVLLFAKRSGNHKVPQNGLPQNPEVAYAPSRKLQVGLNRSCRFYMTGV